ncbi:MAG: D-alanyl-D-alanine carboxypeptidase [Lachnospiraceae bacterium]|nr:D-alanyl-D-alanine carboxypeptidase [Lachnospiraceae bacterium]MCI9545519.1 D-alanyl-D-alanine carboxypeptidase [Lachnospiraceae bacterium]
MQKLLKGMLVFLAVLLAAGGWPQGIYASSKGATISSDQIPGWPKAPKIVETTGVLIEDSTNTILYDKGMHQRMYPASTTKVLSALLAIENSDLSEEVVFTETGTREVTADSANIGMQVGEVLTMEQCLYAMMLSSANEVSSQVAEHVAGSVEKFVEMMNQKAQELGCTDSHFANANGWHDDNHYTSAYDMAKILQAAIRNETFCAISGSQSYVIPPTNYHAEARELGNHHAMLMPGHYHYEGVFAGKTGNTDQAGNTLLTACKKNDITLICMVMQSQEADVVDDTAKLLDYGYGKFQKLQMTDPAQTKEGGYAYVPAGLKAKDIESQDTPREDLVFSQYLYQGVPVGTALAAPAASANETDAAPAEDSLEEELSKVQSTGDDQRVIYYVIIGVLSLLILGGVLLIIKTIYQRKKQ